jgi:hypothetical protein
MQTSSIHRNISPADNVILFNNVREKEPITTPLEIMQQQLFVAL